jgi:hypothetical protein
MALLEPGSEPARAIGCRCPDTARVDHADGTATYSRDPDCPLHPRAHSATYATDFRRAGRMERVRAVEKVTAAIRRCRFSYASEEQLQEGLAAALAEQGLDVEREVILDAASRVDLLVGRVAIEVKVDGAATAVLRQLRRYATSDRVDALVLVTGRARHTMPGEIDGKPVHVVKIFGAGL